MKKIFAQAFILVLILIVSNADLQAQTRIRFAKGRTSATVSGIAGGGSGRTYVLGARYGQYLSANVSSRRDCVTFSNGATTTSYITRRGDNYLYLRNSCGSRVNYTLTVSINYGSD